MLLHVSDATGTTPPDDDGWVPVDGVGEPDEMLEMTDLASMYEVTHPIRGSVLRRLKRPHTVAEVAASMGVPVTRLYHHVNRLAEAGLIRVVATRQVAAVTERRYQVVARSFRLHRDVFGTLDRSDLAKAMGSVFDLARIGFERLVEAGGLDDIGNDDDESTISLGEISLTHEQRVELVSRLNELFEEFGEMGTDEGPDTQRVTVFVAAFPEADQQPTD